MEAYYTHSNTCRGEFLRLPARKWVLQQPRAIMHGPSAASSFPGNEGWEAGSCSRLAHYVEFWRSESELQGGRWKAGVGRLKREEVCALPSTSSLHSIFLPPILSFPASLPPEHLCKHFLSPPWNFIFPLSVPLNHSVRGEGTSREVTVKMKALISLLNLRDGAKRKKPVYLLYSCNAKATLGENSKSGGPRKASWGETHDSTHCPAAGVCLAV